MSEGCGTSASASGEETASKLWIAALERVLCAMLGGLVLIVGLKLEVSFVADRLVAEASIPRNGVSPSFV
jgi:hypothetical protein